MNEDTKFGRPIAGIGAVCATGQTAGDFFEKLCRGQSGLAEIHRFDTSQFRGCNAYPMVNRAPDRMANATDWLIRAVAEAAGDAGLGERLTGVPIIVGTGLRELRSVELAWQGQHRDGPRHLDFGPALRERFGCTEVYTLSNACAASLHALGLAHDLLELDQADTVIAAGVDTITVSMYAGLDMVQPCTEAVRPFDACRKGVLLGDGAAAVVLRRNGPGHAMLRGVGISCDASHVTAPDPDGIVHAMRAAFERAGVRAADVDLVYAHGTGTALNDAAEATALTNVFSGHRPMITAIKGMIGHTSGASGLHSLVAAVGSLRTGCVPAMRELIEPVPEARSLHLVTTPLNIATIDVVQVNSFGFGGVNAVAIMGRAA